MKLIDLINRVDRSKENSFEPSIEDFASEFGIHENFDWKDDKAFGEKIKGHYLVKWYSTDSYVGTAVYYMDDQPIAVSIQAGRKADPEIEFTSKEAGEAVRDLILSLLPKPMYDFRVIDNLDEELEEFYSVEFSGRLLVDDGFVDGKPCTVIDKHRDDRTGYSEKLTVQFEDGTTRQIKTSDFKIRMHFK